MKEALDYEFYDRLVKLCSFEAYNYFNDAAEQRDLQKVRFLSGEVRNPSFNYPELDSYDFTTHADKMEKLLSDMRSSKMPLFMKDAYLDKILLKWNELELMKAARDGDMNEFAEKNVAVYGDLDIQSYRITLHRQNFFLEEAIKAPKSESARVAAMGLLRELPEELIPFLFFPSQAFINEMQKEIKSEMGYLIDQVEKKRNYTATEIVENFNVALNKLGIDDWQSIVDMDTSATGISTNQEKKLILVPAARHVNSLKMKQLILHEVRTHVYNRHVGENSRAKILGLGLAGYEEGEEAIAVLRDRALAGKIVDFAGADGFFAVAMATGMDGKKRDFRDLYDLLVKYFIFMKTMNGKNTIEEIIEDAKEAAWKRCVRTFRGANGKIPGVCYLKDKMYREGSTRVWMNLSENISLLKYASMGKIDVSNKKHLEFIKELENYK